MYGATCYHIILASGSPILSTSTSDSKSLYKSVSGVKIVLVSNLTRIFTNPKVEFPIGKIFKLSPYLFLSLSFNQCRRKLFTVIALAKILLLLSALDYRKTNVYTITIHTLIFW